MSGNELKTQVNTELNRLARAVRELDEIKSRMKENPSSTIEVTAAGALLAQFYAGFERILRRIAAYHDVEMPSGPQSHVDLVEMFRSAREGHGALPGLIDDELAAELAHIGDSVTSFTMAMDSTLSGNACKTVSNTLKVS